MSLPPLPLEVLDIILRLVTTPTPFSESHPLATGAKGDARTIKHTILNCALVCKEWLPDARRHFLSVYFPHGRIRIQPIPYELTSLIDVLYSPLSTIGAEYLRVLCVDPKVAVQDVWRWDKNSEIDDPGSFFAALANLHRAYFLSSNTLIFEGINPRTCIEYDERLPTPSPSPISIFSKTKYLEIYNPWGTSWEDNVHAIRFCSSVQKIVIRGKRYVSAALVPAALAPLYRAFPPPSSLHSLDLDIGSLIQMHQWLRMCEPIHAQISSCSIQKIYWEDHMTSPELRSFFKRIAANLRELEFDFLPRGSHKAGGYGGIKRVPAEISVVDSLTSPFSRNLALKCLKLRGGLSELTEILPHLFRQDDFAPNLEMLEVVVSDYEKSKTSFMTVIITLCSDLCSRPSFQQMTMKRERSAAQHGIHNLMTSDDDWNDIVAGIRKHFVGRKAEGMIELM
ncbi:hypothetical protein AN958_09306 [Leucoagaricus sp. SymC.cos]|nr:hypothetical protein AN958_09306 [Leucoagaricus sp. SymC.cos]